MCRAEARFAGYHANRIKVLNGTQLAFKVGTGNALEDRISVSLSAATVASLDTSLVSGTITDASSAGQALTYVTGAIDAQKGDPGFV